MARLFISFLGTGNYLPCNYCLPDEGDGARRVDNVRFVQTALLGLHCADFGPEDRALIACTPQAREKHLEALRHELEARGWPGRVEALPIPEPGGTDDAWEIFRIFNDAIHEGDAITFDITHSFRFLPLLFTVLIQYLKVTKDIRLEGVYYGAFERLGPPRQVEAMPVEERDAPIMDMTPFLGLFDWSVGIDRFLRSGQPDDLNRLVQQEVQPVLRETRGKNETARALRGIAQGLTELAEGIDTVRGQGLTEFEARRRILEPLQRVQTDVLPPLQPVLERLSEDLALWEDQSPENLLHAVGWCIRHGQTQQGYTLLREGILTLLDRRIPELDGIDAEVASPMTARQTRRELLSKLLNVLGGKEPRPESEWQGELADYPEVARAARERIPKALVPCYERITQLRNDINHGGFIQPSKAKSLREELQRLHQEVSALLLC
ncbi:TIGR02221 family CRISPR-associated protein [Ectothiorhodospira mobilis]|uniref:TIGR02221 family CRISPR-associated protein n=1 Tax=Ectothiorhodospira mobilis TaxID=195064 RepID=UPI001EE8028A|nr:TIGR02221 family CRISPR-associated protein [Ectothiorhodospira mobilis]MCG5536813.1 TIGR02221 family CRISPR-associated protein [Ectothiorhodospira mobilis]